MSVTGDRLVEVPTIQAIIRSIALNAAKGNQRSQRVFADLVRGIERENKELHDELLKNAIKYKLDWEHELARREGSGETGPDWLPHPDHIIINPNTGDVEVRGPMTKKEKESWDQLRMLLQEVNNSIAELEEQAVKEPDDPSIEKKLKYYRHLREKVISVIGE